MHIKMFDHQAHYQQNRNAIDAAISAVLESGQLVMGPDVVAFEEEFASYCGSAFSVAVTSGSSALLLALRALGIGPGDEVITVANSDMASSHAISLTGANVVWVDIDPNSYNMNPELLEAAITPKTRAILTVHLYGVPADLNPIAAIAKNYELPIVEDAALATGATYQGKTIGSLGTLTAFSTAPGKILDGVGSGGIVTTNHPLLYQRLNSLRHYGRARPPYKPKLRSEVQWPSETLEIGYNERLDSIHAAVLRIRLRQLDEQLARRRTIAKKYLDLFANTPVQTQQPPTGAEPSWRFFTVRIPGRDRVYAELFQKGIETMLAYLPVNHLDACYRHLGYKPGSLPETEKFATELLALPCHPYLPDADVEEVADTLLGLL
jgi:dTDP-4-amino-4,6-dideoxygalactose transaminase